MQRTTSPLDATDRATLRVFLRRERLYAFLNLLWTFSAMAPVVVMHLLDAGAPLTLTVTAVAVSAGIWQMTRFYQRYSRLAPLREAWSAGWKYTTRGALSGVERVQPGCLRYQVDGRALVMRPLAAPLELADVPEGLRITRFEHAPAADVVLYWMPLGKERGALLGVDYPALPAAERAEVDMDDAAVARSGWQVRDLVILSGVGMVFVLSSTLASDGFGLTQLLLPLCIAALAGAAIYALNRKRKRRLRQDRARMTVVRGAVSEVLDGRVRTGGRMTRNIWYRVGGMLVSPGSALRGPVAIGTPVVLEYLASNDHGYGGQLVSFSAAEREARAERA